MRNINKSLPIILIIMSIVVVILSIMILTRKENDYNSVSHNEDVQMTEWVSPDGVHYWYQQKGYHAVLAPRYDAEGNLVIDNKEN